MRFGYRLIDLTHVLDPNIPTWSGGCGFQQTVITDYAESCGEDQFRVMQLRLEAGVGTHLDAPSHCFPDGRCIGELGVDELLFPAAVLDVSSRAHARYTLSVADLEAYEKTHGRIPTHACVMIYTGWEQYWTQPDAFQNKHVFPAVSLAAAEFLLQREVAALAVDTLSADRPEQGFPVHRAFLGAGKLLFENVANLQAMPAAGAWVLALPLKIKHATEAPMRLVGLVHE